MVRARVRLPFPLVREQRETSFDWWDSCRFYFAVRVDALSSDPPIECDKDARGKRHWLRDVAFTGPPMSGVLILAGFKQACSSIVGIGINSQWTLNLLQHHTDCTYIHC
jgi:hypothetical protein